MFQSLCVVSNTFEIYLSFSTECFNLVCIEFLCYVNDRGNILSFNGGQITWDWCFDIHMIGCAVQKMFQPLYDLTILVVDWDSSHNNVFGAWHFFSTMWSMLCKYTAKHQACSWQSKGGGQMTDCLEENVIVWVQEVVNLNSSLRLYCRILEITGDFILAVDKGVPSCTPGAWLCYFFFLKVLEILWLVYTFSSSRYLIGFASDSCSPIS